MAELSGDTPVQITSDGISTRVLLGEIDISNLVTRVLWEHEAGLGAIATLVLRPGAAGEFAARTSSVVNALEDIELDVSSYDHMAP